jgi:hypothetical protein
MAAEVKENILLDTDLTGDLPTNSYKVRHDGLERIYEPAVSMERSLTGKLHVHRLTSAGVPVVFDNYRYTLILTLAEKNQIAADLGKIVYFMPHYRDDADAATYRTEMLFSSMTEVHNIDPMLEWWTATIELVEATGQSV